MRATTASPGPPAALPGHERRAALRNALSAPATPARDHLLSLLVLDVVRSATTAVAQATDATAFAHSVLSEHDRLTPVLNLHRTTDAPTAVPLPPAHREINRLADDLRLARQALDCALATMSAAGAEVATTRTTLERAGTVVDPSLAQASTLLDVATAALREQREQVTQAHTTIGEL